MVKNAYKKGNTDNSVAFSGIFMPEKDAIRSFRAFSKKPTVERHPLAGALASDRCVSTAY